MPVILLSCLLAFLMGAAVQRGTTCAVLAVEEALFHRRFDRFIGFLECGFWAALAIIALGGGMGQSYAGWLLLVPGAALFGVGAVLNDACAFGTIGRIGSGRPDFLLTGAGAWAGMALMLPLAGAPGAGVAVEPVGLIAALCLLGGLMALRISLRRRALSMHMRITGVMGSIGVLGAVIGWLHQPWPWMRILERGPDADQIALMITGALVAGSIAHGLAFRRFRFEFPGFKGLARRLSGGLLMGAGAALVPGGNDALILAGVPHGDLRAIAGYFVMTGAIALALTAARKMAR